MATTERLTPERRRALTRETLVDAARRVFARRGYEAGTVEEIAAEAGFSTGAIYSNFAGKADLFLAVFEQRNAMLTDAYRSLLDQPEGEIPELAEVAQVWDRHELADRDSLLLALEFRLAALRNPRLARKLGRFEAHTEQTIASFIAERLQVSDVGEPPVPIEDFAAVIYAANQGIWQHVAICATDHTKLFETFLTLLVRNLGRPENRG